MGAACTDVCCRFTAAAFWREAEAERFSVCSAPAIRGEAEIGTGRAGDAVVVFADTKEGKPAAEPVSCTGRAS
ncbi:hypothetical protein PS9374_04653 [Planomonospora sphaerica]|uniref:Uncharacterized protein n=2 Tax=Planomonospora sphaerica TaxID=161355 RepID=A0A171DJH9_9ACTN|nr:hypothetical protein PS9374_04653 [Planomonospora sphaerica]